MRQPRKHNENVRSTIQYGNTVIECAHVVKYSTRCSTSRALALQLWRTSPWRQMAQCAQSRNQTPLDARGAHMSPLAPIQTTKMGPSHATVSDH